MALLRKTLKDAALDMCLCDFTGKKNGYSYRLWDCGTINHPTPLQSGLKNTDNENGFNQRDSKIDVKSHFSLNISINHHPVRTRGPYLRSSLAAEVVR